MRQAVHPLLMVVDTGSNIKRGGRRIFHVCFVRCLSWWTSDKFGLAFRQYKELAKPRDSVLRVGEGRGGEGRGEHNTQVS